MSRPPASSRPPKGATTHDEFCSCHRCLAFQPGNALALKHGAYSSPARLGPEVDAVATELVPLVPAYSDSDAPLVGLLALTLRRVARAEPVIAAAEEEGDPEGALRLRADQHRWAATAARMLDALGMSPTARARLGLDLARGRSALHEYVDAAYGDEEAVDA